MAKREKEETGTLIIGLYGGEGGGSVILCEASIPNQFFLFLSFLYVFCSGQLSENDISVEYFSIFYCGWVG